MSIEVLHVGDLFRVIATFTDITGTLVDPTTVSLSVLDPSGNTDTYTFAGGQITKASTGVYRKDVEVDEIGEWRYKWTSTGTGQGGEPGEFVVEGHPV
jgi:hypothetical protein